MNTDTSSQSRPPTTEESHTSTLQNPPAPVADKPSRPQLSLTQIAGGSLAAVTAAALGSRLGVAGTVLGAGLASVATAVGSVVYTTSLHRTRDKVQKVWVSKVRVHRSGSATALSPRTPVESRQRTLAEPGPATPVEPVETSGIATRRGHRGFPWRTVVIGALSVFALAALTITGLEAISGRTLSGGDGTTIQRVTHTGSNSQQKKPTDTGSVAPDKSEPSAAPTASDGQPEQDPSTAPSEQAPPPQQSEAPQQGQQDGSGKNEGSDQNQGSGQQGSGKQGGGGSGQQAGSGQ